MDTQQARPLPSNAHPLSSRRRAKDLRLQGRSWNSISVELGVDQRTIRRWLPASDYQLTAEQAAEANRRAHAWRRAERLAARPDPMPGVLWASRHGEWFKVLVDLDDWETYRHTNWGLVCPRRAKPPGYPSGNFNGRREYLHRLILGLAPGHGMKRQTDHINRDPLDNRRANLRIVTPKENCANRGGIYATRNMGDRAT